MYLAVLETCLCVLARQLPLQKHIKLDIVLEPRVRESRPAKDIVLLTCIYAPHSLACANGIGLPRILDSACANGIRLPRILEFVCANGLRLFRIPEFACANGIRLPRIPEVAYANGIELPRIPDSRRPPAARAAHQSKTCESLRFRPLRALACGGPIYFALLETCLCLLAAGSMRRKRPPQRYERKANQAM